MKTHEEVDDDGDIRPASGGKHERTNRRHRENHVKDIQRSTQTERNVSAERNGLCKTSLR